MARLEKTKGLAGPRPSSRVVLDLRSKPEKEGGGGFNAEEVVLKTQGMREK